MSFLDDNCLVFDTEEENKLEYTQIHNVCKVIHQLISVHVQQFKKTVDDLLSELMAELGVTQDQFLMACEKASANPLHKKIVDQITAVDNFIAFKRLMVKRNTELNEQAIKMLTGQSQQQQQPAPQQQTPVTTGPQQQPVPTAPV